jgi:hypothetical protein
MHISHYRLHIYTPKTTNHNQTLLNGTQQTHNHSHPGIRRPRGLHSRTTVNWRYLTRRCQTNNHDPTTRRHPLFLLPILKNLVYMLYQLGNDSTNTNTRYTTQTLSTLLDDDKANTVQLDPGSAHIIHEYHDIATNIWPMQPARQDTSMPTQLIPPISRRPGLR